MRPPAHQAPIAAARSLAPAIAWWLGFHVVGWVSVVGLAWSGVALAQVQGAEAAFGALVLWSGAGLLAWSIRPRWPTFEAPGLRIREADQPRLFAELRSLCERAGQPFPGEVYVTGDVNAFVGERGGGRTGTVRMIGVGIPLLQILDRGQLRAVLAHELGHFAAGDTRLGPWVHRTRCALAQATATLGRSPMGWPLRLFAVGFDRLTRDASRAQELAADRLAARWVGRSTKERALKTVYGTAAGFEAYLRDELLPVLEEGWRPPLAKGFAEFLRHHGDTVERAVELALRTMGDPDDTHPPLRERLAAIAGLDEGSPREDDDVPAIDWIDGVDELERALIAGMFGDAELATRPSTPWPEAAANAYAARWSRHLAEHADRVPAVTSGELPELCARMAATPAPGEDGEAQALAAWSWTAGAALAAALVDVGWQICTRPGAPLLLSNGVDAADPFGWIEDVVAGRRSGSAVAAQLASLGIDQLPLGDARPPCTTRSTLAEKPALSTPSR